MKSFLLALFSVLTLSGGPLYVNSFRDTRNNRHLTSSQDSSRDSRYLTSSLHSSRPAIQYLQHNSRPGVQNLQHKSRPDVQYIQYNKKPDVQYLQHNSRPNVQYVEHNSRPNVQYVEHNSKPDVQFVQHYSKPDVQYLQQYSRTNDQNHQHTSRPNVQYLTSTIKNVNNSLSHISHKLPGLSSMSITRSHPEKKDIYMTGNLPDVVDPFVTRSHKKDQDIVISTMGQAGYPAGYSGRRPIETPGPFSPRFQVAKYEVSDSEWLEEIREGFHDSGLVPGVLPGYPGGLVNINFGPHSCVHMGSELPADRTSSQPSRVSFPASTHQLYSLVMVDVTLERLHWMIINIPGTSVASGQDVAQYQPPEPLNSSPGGHLYLAVALLQSGVINKRHPSIARRSSHLCQFGPREDFQVRSLMEEVGLEMVVAANFFMVQHDNYVQSISSYCDKFQG